jgi:hypothetical protein
MSVVNSDEAFLLQRERCLLEPHSRTSNAVSELLADDFVEFGSSGQRYSKSDVIQSLKTESATKLEASDFRVRFITPEVALITYVTRRSGSLAARSLRSSLWRQVGGSWQLVFHQGTPSA